MTSPLTEVRRQIVQDWRSGPAALKASSPKLVRIPLTSIQVSAERSLLFAATVGDEAAVDCHTWWRVETALCGPRWRPRTRRAAALEASSAGVELVRYSRHCRVPVTHQASGSVLHQPEATPQVVADAVVQHVAGFCRPITNFIKSVVKL